ncbi:hypothetical protein FOCC_FOCC017525, partial [Frankliniella occidentalis]
MTTDTSMTAAAASPRTQRRSPRGHGGPAPRLSLLVLAALVASASALKGRAVPRRPPGPRIDPELDDYVLDSNDTLKLRCQSAFPVRWVIPETAEEHAKKSVYFERKIDDQPYIIHLEVPNLMYLQTGYYRCVDNDTDTTHSSNLEDRSHVASIYVYVR